MIITLDLGWLRAYKISSNRLRDLRDRLRDLRDLRDLRNFEYAAPLTTQNLKKNTMTVLNLIWLKAVLPVARPAHCRLQAPTQKGYQGHARLRGWRYCELLPGGGPARASEMHQVC